MKQIDRHFIAAFLFSLSTLLLCLSSCQSSDNTKTGEGAMVASLPLKAQMGEASSRVGMTDSYNGAFSCYWNSDKLNIYHRYVLNGTVQSMMSLPFSTTATSGTSATFSYTGTDAYRYNPGARLYAFSSNTSGGYTQSVAADGTSTLKAQTLASQLGTLADCAKYDALYGSATVNFDTGLPGVLTMHHLFGMLNLHLTNANFSASYPVTVTLNSSASNILPGNDGTATFGADGSTLTPNGSDRWGTNWYTTVIPTTNREVDVYFMTWPFSSIGGTFVVSCSDASANSYTARSVTLSDFTLSAAQLKSKPLAITNAPAATNTSYSKLYAWDATDFQPVTVGVAPTNANLAPVASFDGDHIGRALYACASCPNYNEMCWYVTSPCYWDDGNVTGGNTTSYSLADGTTTKAGMWFMKKSKIPGFSSTTPGGGNSAYEVTPLPASMNLDDYFFLPAAGSTDYDNGAYAGGGMAGLYWLSTPYPDTWDDLGAFALMFGSTFASVNGFSGYRSYGFCLWQAQ